MRFLRGAHKLQLICEIENLIRLRGLLEEPFFFFNFYIYILFFSDFKQEVVIVIFFVGMIR